MYITYFNGENLRRATLEMKVDHIQITVPKNEESAARAFYREVLGLSELENPPILQQNGGFWLHSGNVDIHVGLEDGVNRRATKAHLALCVEDLEIIRQKLISVGIECKTGSPLPGMDRFECRDPFGNRLEFLVRIGPMK